MNTQTIALEKANVPSAPDQERTERCVKALKPGMRLAGLVGAMLVAVVYLILQSNQLPQSSVSYSLLNAIISLLVNVSSSALLKVFWFVMSLFGASRWITSGERLS